MSIFSLFIFSCDEDNPMEPSLCNEIEEVELWGTCYNIETTTSITLQEQGITGEIPPEIGNLTNLTYLYLGFNDLTGDIPYELFELENLHHVLLNDNRLSRGIPQNICNFFNDCSDCLFSIHNNELCPPYPECIEKYIVYQYTSNCP